MRTEKLKKLINTNFKRCDAFTLAEVLITLGVIGVVAAVTLPVLMTNIQERIQKEQVRSAKYKLTLATDKMKSLGLLGEQYGTIAAGDSTEKFVQELSKHFKIAKICDNQHLTECWTTNEINVLKANGNFKPIQVSSLKTGANIDALGSSTKHTRTMGIVTADGVPMILTYSPNCTPLEAEKTYSWSTIDGKPETNATTNCISLIMDINGNKKPNRFGKDVRTLNSLFGAETVTSYNPLQHNGSDQWECNQLKDKLGIQNCRTDDKNDYWGGAVKYCHDRGLHLPSGQTLANMAGSKYGMSNLSVDTYIYSNATCSNVPQGRICVIGDSLPTDQESSFSASIEYWSASESSATTAFTRRFSSSRSEWDDRPRYSRNKVLCLGD